MCIIEADVLPLDKNLPPLKQFAYFLDIEMVEEYAPPSEAMEPRHGALAYGNILEPLKEVGC